MVRSDEKQCESWSTETWSKAPPGFFVTMIFRFFESCTFAYLHKTDAGISPAAERRMLRDCLVFLFAGSSSHRPLRVATPVRSRRARIRTFPTTDCRSPTPTRFSSRSTAQRGSPPGRSPSRCSERNRSRRPRAAHRLGGPVTASRSARTTPTCRLGRRAISVRSAARVRT